MSVARHRVGVGARAIVVGAVSAAILALLSQASWATEEPLVLPPDANASNQSGVSLVACPDVLHFHANAAAAANAARPYDPYYPGNGFGWRVETGAEVLGAPWDDSPSSLLPQRALPAAWEPGSTQTVRITPLLYQDPREDAAFSMTVRVLNPTAFAGGSGTADDPWIVRTPTQLSQLRCHVDRHFRLGQNIDLAGVRWLPITGGSTWSGEPAPWRGTLDGGGFTIANVAVAPTRTDNGLFGDVEDSQFRNLTVRSVTATAVRGAGSLIGGSGRSTSLVDITVSRGRIITQDGNAGLLASALLHSSTLRRVTVSGTVRAERNSSSVGGLLGSDASEGSVLRSVAVDVAITAGSAPIGEETTNVGNTGCLIGYASDHMLVRGARVTCTLAARGSRISSVGGLFGYQHQAELTQASVDATITALADGEAREVGGLTGYLVYGVLDRVTAKVSLDVTAAEIDKVSGGIGAANGAGLTDASLDTTVTTTLTAPQGQARSIGGALGFGNESYLEQIQGTTRVTVRPGVAMAADAVHASSVGGLVGSTQDGVTVQEVSLATTVRVNALGKSVGGLMGSTGYSSGAMSDVVVFGSIAATAQSVGVGGVIGSARRESWLQVIAAVTVSVASGSSEVGPLLGGVSAEPGIGSTRMTNVFWDSTRVKVARPTGHPGRGATTAQLQSADFLKARGFAIGSTWRLARGRYPSLATTPGA